MLGRPTIHEPDRVKAAEVGMSVATVAAPVLARFAMVAQMAARAVVGVAARVVALVAVWVTRWEANSDVAIQAAVERVAAQVATKVPEPHSGSRRLLSRASRGRR